MCETIGTKMASGRSSTRSLVLMAAVTCAATSAMAGVIAVQDGSFESPVITNEQNVSPTWGLGPWPSGSWAVTGTGGTLGTYNPMNTQYAGSSTGSGGLLPGTADGQQCASFDLNGGAKTVTMTYQGASLGIYEAGGTYTLSAAGGMRLDQKAGVYWSGSYHYPTFTVSLLARDSSLSPWLTVGTSAVTTLPDAGIFVDGTCSYPTDPAVVGKEIGISVTMNAAWTQGQLDNVRLTSVVPEPAAMGVLGLAAIAGLRRNRRTRL